jgi:hypothetical protein
MLLFWLDNPRLRHFFILKMAIAKNDSYGIAKTIL